MLEVLDKPSTRAMLTKISVAGYHKLFEQGIIPEKTELIRGVLIEKMSISPEHAYAITCLMTIITKLFDSPYFVRTENPLTLSGSEPEPDLAVIEGPASLYAKRHPSFARLVIEVSKTTYDLDYDKQFIYAEAGIPEYWLVNLEKSETEVYRRPEAGRYLERTIYSKGKEILLEGSAVNLDEIY